ncbi:hypothetical protein MKEN_00545800 [Mycena kentingensis (nom. inval.)]|nr:hypothetical protein MKEN_00545800 [Mycena kentingensis (nom. inval.)]
MGPSSSAAAFPLRARRRSPDSQRHPPTSSAAAIPQSPARGPAGRTPPAQPHPPLDVNSALGILYPDALVSARYRHFQHIDISSTNAAPTDPQPPIIPQRPARPLGLLRLALRHQLRCQHHLSRSQPSPLPQYLLPKPTCPDIAPYLLPRAKSE